MSEDSPVETYFKERSDLEVCGYRTKYFLCHSSSEGLGMLLYIWPCGNVGRVSLLCVLLCFGKLCDRRNGARLVSMHGICNPRD